MVPTLLSLALLAPPAQLTVGFAEVDATPDVKLRPVWLAGFGQNRPADAVLDPIMVRAVALGDGERRVALVSVDVVGLFLPFVEAVRAKLPGFAAVVVSATHNHDGPDTMGLWGRSPLQSGVDPDYMARLEAAVVTAVRNADAERKPATAEIGTVRAPELLVDNRLPEVKLDELVAVRFRDAAGAPAGVLLQWNCHPETLGAKNTRVSADYVATTCAELKKRHGGKAVYLSGAVGGLMTTLGLDVKSAEGVSLPSGSAEKTRRYGELLADAAGRALDGAKPVRLTPIQSFARPLLTPVDNPLYKLAWSAKLVRRPIYHWGGDPDATPRETNDVGAPAAVRTEVGLLRLGELDALLVPGEIYPELLVGGVPDPAEAGADHANAPAERPIYPALRNRHRMVVGLANDELGYLIPKRQWDEKPPHCYGRAKPQYGEGNSTGPDAGRVVSEALHRVLAEAGAPH